MIAWSKLALLMEAIRLDREHQLLRVISSELKSDEIVHGVCGGVFAECIVSCVKYYSWKCALQLIRLGADCLSIVSDDKCIALLLADSAPEHVCLEMISNARSHSIGRALLITCICATRGIFYDLSVKSLSDDGSVEYAIAIDSWSLVSKRVPHSRSSRARVLCRCAYATECLDALADYKFMHPVVRQFSANSYAQRPDLSVAVENMRADDPSGISMPCSVFADACRVPIFCQTEALFDSMLSLALVLRARKSAAAIFSYLQVGGRVPVLKYTWAFILAWMCVTEEEAVAVVRSEGAARAKVCNMRGESALSVFIHRRWSGAVAAVLREDTSPAGLLCRGSILFGQSMYHMALFSERDCQTVCQRLFESMPRIVFDAEFHACLSRLMDEESFAAAGVVIRCAIKSICPSIRSSFLIKLEYMLLKKAC